MADVNLLCAQQFKAKSRSLAAMEAHALCAGDLKQFKLGKDEGLVRRRATSPPPAHASSATATAAAAAAAAAAAPSTAPSTATTTTAAAALAALPPQVRVAFAVVETTDPNSMLQRVSELVPEVIAVRAELAQTSGHDVDCMFLAIVDIVSLQTHVLVAGERERSLAAAAGFNAAPLSEAARGLIGEESARQVFAMAPGKVRRQAGLLTAMDPTSLQTCLRPPALLKARLRLPGSPGEPQGRLHPAADERGGGGVERGVDQGEQVRGPP